MTEPLYRVHSITVKVDGDRAIVRKVLIGPNGDVIRKGLTLSGKWAFIKEGEAYPPECILSVEQYKDGYKVWDVGEFEAKREAEVEETKRIYYEQELRENQVLEEQAKRAWSNLWDLEHGESLT